MTELEIINAMLAAVGSNGVESTIGRHPSLIKAQPILSRVNRTVQNRGHWFNTEWGLELHPTVDNEFYVPQSTLKCDTTIRRLPYVRRGRRMYDPHTHTYNIEETSICVDVVILLDYDLLPHTAADYIRASATLQMVTNAASDSLTIRTAMEDHKETKLSFERERRTQADTSLRDNPEYQRIMGGLLGRAGRSTNPLYIGGRNG